MDFSGIFIRTTLTVFRTILYIKHNHSEKMEDFFLAGEDNSCFLLNANHIPIEEEIQQEY